MSSNSLRLLAKIAAAPGYQSPGQASSRIVEKGHGAQEFEEARRILHADSISFHPSTCIFPAHSSPFHTTRRSPSCPLQLYYAPNILQNQGQQPVQECKATTTSDSPSPSPTLDLRDSGGHALFSAIVYLELCAAFSWKLVTTA